MKIKRGTTSIFAIAFAVVIFGIMLITILNEGGFGAGNYVPSQDTGYELTDYNVDIVVNQDGTMDITEEITANFLSESRGLVRWLPIAQTVSFLDENNKLVEKRHKNTISNFKVLNGVNLAKTETSNGCKLYYFGDEDRFIRGHHTYKFSYNFNMGDDQVKAKDLFYFNILGNGWDTSIKDFDFRITFPTAVELDDLSFYIGRYGESSTDAKGDIEGLVVSGNVVSGKVAELGYAEAVTVYAEFEKGFFDWKVNHKWSIVVYCVGFGLLASVVGYWFVKRRKTPIVEVVEFKAPNGLTPTEVGYLNDGEITSDDLSALIVYWASKGWLKLTEHDKDVVVIEKLVETAPDEMKSHEKTLFNDLFRSGKKINSNQLSLLSGDAAFRSKEFAEMSMKDCFAKQPDGVFKFFGIFASILNVLLMLATPGIKIWMFVMALLPAIGLFAYPSLVKYHSKHEKRAKAFIAIDIAMIFGGLIAYMVGFNHYFDVAFSRIVPMLLSAALLVVYPLLERYTEKGKKLMGSVRGLKNYILTAEKDRIAVVASQNPELFYEILPYAYVLGVSDVYMEKFEGLIIQPPTWYECSDPTDVYIATRIVNHSMNKVSRGINNSIVAHRASQIAKGIASSAGGGGRSGGGGFSGGGGGGGGGGRW